jgi:chaperonin cofactor prefoldin
MEIQKDIGEEVIEKLENLLVRLSQISKTMEEKDKRIAELEAKLKSRGA